MKAYIHFFLILALGAWATPSNSQAFGPVFDSSVTVRDSTGDLLSNPWTGGLNFAQFSRIDVDRDGNKDLFVFDRSGEKVEVFLQKGNRWEHSDAYDHLFPRLSEWALCRDFNNDGARDIFTAGTGGVKVYENLAGNELSFKTFTDRLLSDHYPNDTSTDPINIYVRNSDVPAIDDIDGDGDLDILSFHIFGTQVEYHRNMALEETGKTDTMTFDRKNACWGFFSEGGSSNTVNLDDSCSGNVQNPEWTNEGGQRHSGSTLLTLDKNGDGVKELVLGDLSSDQLKLLENGGGPSSSHMVSVTHPFPDNGNPVNLPIFPAAFYLDVDHDGTKDLLASPAKGATSVDRKSILYYHNKGSDSIPDIQFVKRNFLQDSTIDLGEGAFPTFVDIDQDGDQDLFVGNQKLHTLNGEQASSIAFFENVGTSSFPEFQMRTTDYEDFSNVGMGQALHPAFGDISDSPTPDLIIGDAEGHLHYFKNTMDPGSASFTLIAPKMENHQGQRIDVGQFAAPTLVDINRDGLLDLIVGEKDGNLNYYENVGSTTSPSFAFRTDSLGDVQVTSPSGYEGYSVPRFFVDSTSFELVVGSKSGRLHYYKDINKNLNGSFQKLTGFFGGIEQGKRSAPAVVELNGDDKLDMIVGEYGGGIAFYNGTDQIQTNIKDRKSSLERKLYPNPVRSGQDLFIHTAESLGDKKPKFRLYDAKGRQIPIQSIRRDKKVIRISLPELPQGIYFIRPTRSAKAHRFIVE